VRSLTSRLGHGHYLQNVSARVFKIKAAPAPPLVDLIIGMTEWPAAIGNLLRLDPIKNSIELRIAYVKRIVMTLNGLGIKVRLTCRALFVGKIERQAIIDLDLCEVARLYS
jgi:hypothetical protein